tara:strand:+ start:1551 stop:2330 length:780 start_codon:yes stop_codon:yes gene_type:complete
MTYSQYCHAPPSNSKWIQRFAKILRMGMVSFGIALYATAAHAQLTVDKLWIDFNTSSSTREDVLLRNESDRRYYISIEPSEIIDPGLPSEARREYDNPEDLGLLISPNRLILEPGEFRALRLVSINEDMSRDRVYRIRITPKVGAITGVEAEGDNRNANLVILMAYDLLAIVRPQQGKADIDVERTDEALTLRNSGATNTLLVDGAACFTENDEDHCTPLPDTRLYSGAEVRFPLPRPDAQVRVTARDGTNTVPRKIEF